LNSFPSSQKGDDPVAETSFRVLRSVWRRACLSGLSLIAIAPLVFSQGPPAPDQQKQAPPPNPNSSKNSAFTLDVETSASSGSVTLTRPDSGFYPLNLIYSGPTLKDVPISISVFTSDGGGQPLDVALQSSCQGTAGKDSRSINSDAESYRLIPLCLIVGKLPINKPYTGRLTIAPASGPVVIKTITFNRPAIPQGMLVVDQNTLAETFSRRFWGNLGHIEGTFSVRLHEKTSAIPLEGISVRLESGQGGSENGLDVEKNLAFLWNGQQSDLARYPPKEVGADPRNLGEGQQSIVTVQVHDLKPGDYTAVLRFSAINSAADDAQKLELHVHIRDSIWRAVFLLLLAVAISFVATKVLSTMRCRASLLTQIGALQPAWFSALPPARPVVWLRAVLHKTKTLSKRFWLTSPDLIAANLNDARRMLVVLDNIRQLRGKLQLALAELVYRRVAIGLDHVMARLGESPLTDADIQSFNGELAPFNDWLDPQKFPTILWNDVQPALQSLQNEITALTVQGFQDQPFIASLIQAGTQALATPPSDRPGVEQIYEKYVRLRVLWEERDGLNDLLGPAQGELSSFLEVADQREWKRIEADPLQLKLPERAGTDDLEAFDVVHFSVNASDPKIERTYIFRHKIQYQWEFQLQPRTGNRQRVVLQPVSLGPSVVQYFPFPGPVSVTVTLTYGSELKHIEAPDPTFISPSSDFQPYKILAGTEIMSWVISLVTALATGLSMFYFKGTSWGTYPDYLTLVLWGMGVDQGKTFLQALQANSSP
jgi:hypothetical protein